MSAPTREALCFTEKEWSARTCWPTPDADAADLILVVLPTKGYRVEKDLVLGAEVPRRATVREAAELLAQAAKDATA